MDPEDVVRIASVLKDDLKETIRSGKRHQAPLSIIIDDLQYRYNGFSPKYETYGRTLRPYATALGLSLHPNDRELHE